MAPVAQAEQSAVIQQNAGDRADAALRQGPDAIKDALAEAGDDPALAKALLGRAKTRVVKGEDDPPAEVLASAYSMRGCRARSWSRHDIVLPPCICAGRRYRPAMGLPEWVLLERFPYQQELRHVGAAHVGLPVLLEGHVER